MDQIKLALFTRDPASAHSLWPEWFAKDDEASEDEIEEMLDDESEAEYRFETTETPEEMEALINKISSGTMTLDDFTTEDPNGWM